MTKRLQFVVVSASTCLLVLLLLGTVLGRSNAADGDAYKHFAVFSDVVAKIKSDYVEEPNMHNVTLGALNGLLESIDPFASYLNAEQYKQYRDAMTQKKGDVGLVLSRRSGYIGIVDAIPGTPAAVLGLTTYDIIEAINGVSTRDMPLAYAQYLLRGDPGTNVELSVIQVRRGAEAQKKGLTRAKIEMPAVSGKIMNGDVGYVEVPVLDKGRSAQVKTKLAELEKQGAKRFVLDLRNDAEGDLNEGLVLADMFLDKGQMTYLEGQRSPKRAFEADAAVVSKLPVVVLTNRGTAGAAEIAASALADNKRAELVGERTYGMAAERKALTLDDGSAVILAVAKYYNGAGKAIQDTGVTPALVVAEADAPDTEDEEGAPGQAAPPPEPKPGEDVQLKKAIEVLTSGLEAAKKGSAAGAVSAAPPAGAPKGPLNIPRPDQR
ncbi:MAG: S41 family peptidase [Bryobacteraceae bacterium]